MNEEIVKQYQDAISKGLSPKQIELLQVLYYCPNSSATVKELAKALNYSAWQPVNARMGAVGKILSNYVKLDTEIMEGYYRFIGEHYKEIGWYMWHELRAALENLNLVTKGGDAMRGIERLPTEIPPYDEERFFVEGKVLKIYVNKYERSIEARLKCIAHFGSKCYACEFDFGKVYGDFYDGYIHVHHKRPISEIGKEYNVDPINDLVPLCPNCHSVVHLAKPILAVEELKNLIFKSKKSSC